MFAGAAAASRVFNEALAKIAMNAQQGGTTDIGKFDGILFSGAFASNLINVFDEHPNPISPESLQF